MMVLGTMGGGVVILDHLGYRIQHRRPHVAPVLHVALSGDYWASAGKDKKVRLASYLVSIGNKTNGLIPRYLVSVEEMHR